MANLHIAGTTEIDESGVTLSSLKDGKIIDSSSSNYIKFKDGTMICYLSTGTFSNIGANSSMSRNITLPQSYANIDYQIIITKRGGGAYWGNTNGLAYPADKSTVHLEYFNIAGHPSTVDNTSILTIGRWK